MILVTVGAQMPFDRLIEAVDQWAGARGRSDVIAQIGEGGAYRPVHLDARPFVDPVEFRALATAASAIVGHAGMGTILTALELRKPLLVLPRLARLDETRNDHQVATARRFEREAKLVAAYHESDLAELLDSIEEQSGGDGIGPSAQPSLLARLRDFALTE